MDDKVKGKTRVDKSDAEWRTRLTPAQYKVTRRKGTERPWSGEHNHTKTKGVFKCVCCGNPLFHTDAKFDSGTGWPSFTEAIHAEAVREEEDNSLFMRRVEVLCAVCDAHIGHVFPDGPQPTGMRYCMNSIALDHEEEE